MGAHFRFLPTGNGLFAGKLAGRGLLDVPGLLSSIPRGRLGHAPTGARVASVITHHNLQRAPKLVDTVPSFHCPEWPQCGCPGGTMRPECPGRKARVGVPLSAASQAETLE